MKDDGLIKSATEYEVGKLYMFRNRDSDGGYFSHDGITFNKEDVVMNGSILLFIGSESMQSHINECDLNLIILKFLFENKIYSLKTYVKMPEHENFLFYKVEDDFG